LANKKLKRPDNNSPGKYQEDHKEAVAYVNRRLGRAATQKELDKKLKQFKNTGTAIAIQNWHKASNLQVQNEVNLALLTNTIRLKYIPIKSNQKSKWGSKERGRYEALVTINDEESPDFGKTIFYKPTNDWVEDNFTKESLAVIQRIAREMETVHSFEGTSRVEHGYLPLMKPLKHTITKKSKNGQDEEIHNQISKMRYVPPKEYKDLRGVTQMRSEKWYGLIQKDRHAVALQVTLEAEWVNENITKEMQKLLKDVRNTQGYNGFTLIPEGDNEEHDMAAISFLPDAPSVQFKCGTEEHSERRCVLDSAASGLFYLGYHRLVSLLTRTRTTVNLKEKMDPMKFLAGVFENELNPEERKKLQYVHLGKKKLKGWDPIISPAEYLLCAVGIRSSDGKTDHAICIVNGWIFDATLEKALPLTLESLNICSSSSHRSTNFVEVTRGCLLVAR
jgi:hypothetical protein